MKNFNPFFNRIDPIVATCLLKLGKITYRESSMSLFKPGDEIKSLFIILLGKVKLTESKTKRFCQTGETFLEEILLCCSSFSGSADSGPKMTSFDWGLTDLGLNCWSSCGRLVLFDDLCG